VPFERCIAYVAENLAPGLLLTPPLTATPLPSAEPRSPSSKCRSGFRGQEVGWDTCHGILAERGEGVEKVLVALAVWARRVDVLAGPSPIPRIRATVASFPASKSGLSPLEPISYQTYGHSLSNTEKSTGRVQP